MHRNHLRGLAAAALLSGALVAGAAGQPPAQALPDLPMKELMTHVISHSAFEMWKWQGWVSDKDGSRSLFPKNDAEWEDAESAALTLGEVITVLAQPGYRLDVAGWDHWVQEVRRLARQAAEAAEHHDEAKFFDVGEQLDEACEGCHRAVGLVK